MDCKQCGKMITRYDPIIAICERCYDFIAREMAMKEYWDQRGEVFP